MAAPDGSGGFGLVPFGTSEDGFSPAPHPSLGAVSLGMAARTAPSGEIGAIWARTNGTVYEIVFSRFRGGRLIENKIVQAARSPLFTPDLAFESGSRPWAAWIRREGGRDEVVVLEIDREKAWVVNGPGLPGALSPKLLVSGGGDVWVVWTGRSTGHDRIYASMLAEGAWSAPQAIPSDARYPQTSPAAYLDAEGRPCVVWSGYDGNDYEIFTSSWIGSAWTDALRITDNTDADLNPIAAFVPGAGTTVIWSKSTLRGHIVAAAFRQDGGWTGETVIGGFSENPIRSLGLAASGGRIALSWTSGDETFSRVAGVWEILETAVRFFDSTIDIKRVYQYVITALRADGVESPCSDIARDDIT